jgi:ribokinase
VVQPRVFVVGNANVDLTTYVRSFPVDGETVLGTDFSIGMGGKGANQAVACSRAGSPTALIGAIGDDTFGDVMWEGLSSESLSLDYLNRVDTPSGTATIMVEPTGTNRIAVFVGASATITAQNTIDAIANAPQASFLVSQLEIPFDIVSESVHHAKQQGLTTVLNVAPYRILPSELLGATDWIIANEGEAQALLDDAGITATVDEDVDSVRGRISDWATALGVNLVITLGGEGAVGVQVGQDSFSARAPRVKAVDTVGAGDCFTGYFVSLLDQGFTWQQALNGAVHAASHSVQHPGAQSSYPARDQAEHFASLARRPL